MPTRTQLITLADTTLTPAINPKYFPNFNKADTVYWTSTSGTWYYIGYPCYTNYPTAVIVDFQDGSTDEYYKRDHCSGSPLNAHVIRLLRLGLE
jgi:hypothetical protein